MEVRNKEKNGNIRAKTGLRHDLEVKRKERPVGVLVGRRGRVRS